MENTGLEEALRNALVVFNKCIIGEKIIMEGKNEKITMIGHLDKIIEENVKIKIVLPIIKELGWMSGSMEDVEFEYSCKKMGRRRVDCCLIEKDLKFFIELKAYKENNTEIDGVDDLRDYCFNGDACYGVLTDGINWELYGPFANNNIDYIEYKFDDNNSDSNKKDEIFYPEKIGCQFCFCKCNKNICSIGNVKQIYEDTIKELSIEITTIDNVKEFIVSFLQKFGWEVDENNERGSYLVIKYRDTSIVVMIKAPIYWSGRLRIKKEDKDSLKRLCGEKKVCFGVLTNGKRWAFFNYGEYNKEKPFLLKSVELRDDDKSIDQVVDFLSMFSKGNIKNLHNMITGSKILDCILVYERNQELRNELLEAKENNEKKEALIKKLYDKVQAMNPDLKVPEDYLKNYIRWYGMKNTGKAEKKILKDKVKFTNETGKLYVKCGGKEIEGHDSTKIFKNTLKKIGLDNVAKSDVKNCKVPVVATEKNYSVPSSEKSSYKPIDGYYVMFQGAPKTMAELIIKIKYDLLDKLNSNSIENSDNLREKLDGLFVDII